MVQLTPLSHDRVIWILLLAQVADTNASDSRTWIPWIAVIAWLAGRLGERPKVPHSWDALLVEVCA